MSPRPPTLSPDCRDGKCGACVGDAWDDTTDQRATCQHPCHGPANRDPDLPGEGRFVPAAGVVEVAGRMAYIDVIPIAEQQAIHHNRLRYVELQKLRMGQPNRYEESRYR